MDRSYIAENNVERARLQALVARLTDANMAPGIHHRQHLDQMEHALAGWSCPCSLRIKEMELSRAANKA